VLASDRDGRWCRDMRLNGASRRLHLTLQDNHRSTAAAAAAAAASLLITDAV